MKNLFIVFEGSDGVGKSTLIKELYLILKKSGYDVEVVDKGMDFIDSAISELKNPSRNDYDFNAHFLMATSNSLLTYKQKNFNNKNKIYLVDRYIYTTIAYNVALGFDYNLAVNIASLVPKPDIVFLCCLDEKNMLKRKKKIESIEVGFNELNRNNYIIYQKKVQEIYNQLAIENELFVNVDTKSLNKALELTKKEILNLAEKKKICIQTKI